MHISSVHNARMTTDTRPEPAIRLQQARERAGFDSALAATKRFNWKYETYAQHENGTRGITRAAAKYATAFRVTREWLLFGVEAPAPDDRPQSSVTPFLLRRDGPHHPSKHLLDMARAAGAGGDREVWRVTNQTMISAGYLPGDFLLVDHAATDPDEGAQVLIALNDLEIGSATNHLAQYAPPFAIILGHVTGHVSAHNVDGESVEIKGTVTASWRLND